MSAIDAELAERTRGADSAMVRLCSCGFATDDDDWLAGHLTEHPGHRETDSYWPPDLEAQR